MMTATRIIGTPAPPETHRSHVHTQISLARELIADRINNQDDDVEDDEQSSDPEANKDAQVTPEHTKSR
jgi:hypothetical protein